MASDPGGSVGSWAESPGIAPGLELGLHHDAGEGPSCGDRSGVVDEEATATVSSKVTNKEIFKKEMQISRLREEVKRETDPKEKCLKCEELDVCLRELTVLRETPSKESVPPKIQNWAPQTRRETRRQVSRRREVLTIKDTDYDSVRNIVLQGKAVRLRADASGGPAAVVTEGLTAQCTDIAPNMDDCAEGQEKTSSAVCVGPVSKGLTTSTPEAAECAGIVSDSQPECSKAEIPEIPVTPEIPVPPLPVMETIPNRPLLDSQVSTDPRDNLEVSRQDDYGHNMEVTHQSHTVQYEASSNIQQPGASNPTSQRDRERPPRLFSNVTRSTYPTPQRRNAVRIKYTGPEEGAPTRQFIGKDLLKNYMKFDATEIYALIHVPTSRIYDISFKLPQNLDLFWQIYHNTRHDPIWQHLQVVQLSKPLTVVVTFLFQSEVVALADLQHWLNRQCRVLSPSAKIYDEEGIWNGGYRVKVQLYQDHGVTRHLPHVFYLGSDRGICYYPGQPRLCHRCGGRHLAYTCPHVKCSMCGDLGHTRDSCTGQVICNLCSERGHTFQECPVAQHNQMEASLLDETTEQEPCDPSVRSDVQGERSSAVQGVTVPETTLTIQQNTSDHHEGILQKEEVPPVGEESFERTSEISAEASDGHQGSNTSSKAMECDEEGFQMVKRKSTAFEFEFCKHIKSQESSAVEISPGRFSVLGEDDNEMCPPSVQEHEEEEERDIEVPVSSKRWGAKGHSKRKKTKKVQ